MLLNYNKSELLKKLEHIKDQLLNGSFDGSFVVEIHLTEGEGKKRKTSITLVEKI